MPRSETNKKFNYADYISWPDDERWEIHEGVPSMLTAPSWQHQDILGSLIQQFKNYLSDKPCKVFAAPFDLRLPEPGQNDEESINVVQPDLTVICDLTRLKGSGYFGTPELVIEISSPSSGKIDKIFKYKIYEKAGIPEYWIVEPTDKTVTVFTLGNNKRYERRGAYSEDDSIPLSIFPDFSVNLKHVFEGI